MTTGDLRAKTALAIRAQQTEFDGTQIAALKTLGLGKKVTADDLRVYFHQIRRTGLDPFLKQIYLIERMVYNPDTKQKEPRQTIQTGIDGFRLVARRAADLAGVKLSHDDPQWCGPDGVWKDVWTDPETPPFAARYVIWRGQERFSGIAYFKEYCPLKDEYVDNAKTGRKIPSGQWGPDARPTHMIAKCAEALATRKGFPQDLSGIYLVEELQKDDPELLVATAVVSGTDEPVVEAEEIRDWIAEVNAANTPEDLNRIWTECKDAGERSPEFNTRLAERGVEIRAEQKAAQRQAEDAVFVDADTEADAELAGREESSDAGPVDPA